MLPILTAPEKPGDDAINAVAKSARYTGEFRRDLADSDPLHWGEGTLYVGTETISFSGRLSPGPDFRLYLSPEFVETEAHFERLKSRMAHAGHVRTFENFLVDIPEDVNPDDFNTAVVWCESFGQFISAAAYQ